MDGQLRVDAAVETASRAIPLLEDNETLGACRCHFVLGTIYCSKGNRKEAIEHFEATQVASLRDLHDDAFWTHQALVVLACREGRFDDANARYETTKQHATNNAYTSTVATTS